MLGFGQTDAKRNGRLQLLDKTLLDTMRHQIQNFWSTDKKSDQPPKCKYEDANWACGLAERSRL
jgi:hypothetical protein